MKGNFEKILGKKITGVYCRKNDGPPAGQIFLVFDDGTYFEIYSGGDSYCTVKGAHGLDKGDITKVRKLNHRQGKVTFDAHISLVTTEHMRERIKQTLLYDCEYALKSFSQGFLGEAKESLQDLANNAKLYEEYLPDDLVEDIHYLKESVRERLADGEPATAVVTWVWDMFARLKNLPT